MAVLQTWSVGTNGTASAFASNKSMFDAWNGTAGATVIKIWRIWAFNAQSSSISGAFAQIHFLRTVAGPSGGTALTANAVKHDSTNAALDANVTFGTNRTITYPAAPVLLRRMAIYTDEYAISGASTDEFRLFTPGALIFDGGYASAGVVQPIVLRQNQGLTLTNVSTTATGSIDIYCEFTQE